MIILFSFFVSTFTSYLFINSLFGCTYVFHYFNKKIILSTSLGLGLSPLLTLIALLLSGNLGREIFFFEIITLLTGYIFFIKRKRKYCTCEKVKKFKKNKAEFYKLRKIIIYIFILLLLTAILLFIFYTSIYPHGQWDAWAIWNQHARYIYRGGVRWTDLYSPLVNHSDYPLLLPLEVARFWYYNGSETIWGPIFIAFLFTFITVYTLFVAISQLKSKLQGYLASIILLGTPSFIINGAFQYADIPLSLFVVVSLWLLLSALGSKDNKLLLLSGTFTGFAILTKNEGTLFAVCTVLSLLLYKRLRWLIRYGKYYVLPLMLSICLTYGIKIYFQASNDVVNTSSFISISKNFTDWSRYQIIADYFIHYILSFGMFLLPLPLLLLLYIVYVRLQYQKTTNINSFIPLMIIIFMLFGYFFIFLISPHDLRWHLENSLDRLYLQLWPSLLLSIFILLPTPELLMNKKYTKIASPNKTLP